MTSLSCIKYYVNLNRDHFTIWKLLKSIIKRQWAVNMSMCLNRCIIWSLSNHYTIGHYKTLYTSNAVSCVVLLFIFVFLRKTLSLYVHLDAAELFTYTTRLETDTTFSRPNKWMSVDKTYAFERYSTWRLTRVNVMYKHSILILWGLFEST